MVEVSSPAACAPAARRLRLGRNSHRTDRIPTAVTVRLKAVEDAVDEQHTQGEGVLAPRLPRRIPRTLSMIPVFFDGVSTAAGYTLATLPDPLLASVMVVLCLWVAGTYRRRVSSSGLDIAPTVTVAAAVGAVVVTLFGGQTAGLGDLVLPIGAATLAVLAGRFASCSLSRILRRSRWFRCRVAIVGADIVGMALTRTMLDEAGHGLEPVVVLDDESVINVVSIPGVTTHPVNRTAELLLKANRIDTAVIAFHHLQDADLESLLAEFDRLRCDIYVVPRLWDTRACKGVGDRIGAVPIMCLRYPIHRNRMRHVKSVGERCVAAAALLALGPILVMVAIAQKLARPRDPVLFRQTRVGQHGAEFELLKFRSMTPATVLESETTWTIDGDTRVDALGRFLRASSIDELPQLWNVVRGDMALIGPRPERPHFVDQFGSTIPGYHARHRAPVGMTGWAAINGLAGDTSITDRVRYDNFYITNWSLWFDAKITLRTLWTLIIRFRSARCEDHVVQVEAGIGRRTRMWSLIHRRDTSTHRQPVAESLCRIQ